MTKVVTDTKELVSMPQSVLLARYTMPVESEKLFVCSLNDMELVDGELVGRINKAEYCELTGMKPDSFRKISRRAAKKLRTVEVKLKKSSGGYHDCVLSYEAVYDRPSGTLVLKYAKSLTPYLKEFKKFLDVEVRRYLQLSAKHSHKLYKMCKFRLMYADNIAYETSLEELFRDFCIGDNPPRVNNFINRTLAEAVKDINRNMDIDIEYDLIRGEKNKITGIAFKVKKATILDPAVVPYSERPDYAQVIADYRTMFDVEWLDAHNSQLYQLNELLKKRTMPPAVYPANLHPYMLIAIAYVIVQKKVEAGEVISPFPYLKRILENDRIGICNQLEALSTMDAFRMYPDFISAEDFIRRVGWDSVAEDYVDAYNLMIDSGISPKYLG